MKSFIFFAVLVFSNWAFAQTKMARGIECAYLEQGPNMGREILRFQMPWRHDGTIVMDKKVIQRLRQGTSARVPFRLRVTYISDSKFHGAAQLYNPFTGRMQTHRTNGKFFGGDGYWVADTKGTSPAGFTRVVLFCLQMNMSR